MIEKSQILEAFLSGQEWTDEDKAAFVELLKKSFENSSVDDAPEDSMELITVYTQVTGGVSRKAGNLDIHKFITFLMSKGDRFIGVFGSEERLVCSVYELASGLYNEVLEHLNELEASIVTMLWANGKSHSKQSFYHTMSSYLMSVGKVQRTQSELDVAVQRLISIRSVEEDNTVYKLVEDVKFS
ncbi:hypothetical protein ACEQ77_002436 [Vibrio harveyi]